MSKTIVSIGTTDYTRDKVIEALARLDGLDEATLNSWTDKQLGDRLHEELYGDDYDPMRAEAVFDVTPDLSRTARILRDARRRLETAMDAAEDSAIGAYALGTPETVIARELGVNRMTVRKWLGKL